MKRVALVLLLAAPLFAQQLPPGTERPGETSPEDDLIRHAETLLRQGDFAKAQSTLAPFVTAHPKNARAAYDLGVSDEELNDDRAAEAAYRTAIEADDKQFESRLSLGLLLARKGDTAGAHTQLSSAATLTPSDNNPQLKAAAYRALAQIDAATDPASASQALLNAIQLTGETTADRALAASLAAHSGDDDAAAAAFRRILAQDLGDAASAIGLARILHKQGKDADATAALSAAIKLHPDDTVLAIAAADLLLAQKKPEEALPILDAAHNAHLGNRDVARRLAWVNMQLGHTDTANDLYRSLAATSPQNLDLLNEWADALLRQGQTNQVQTLLTPIVLHPPADADKQTLADAASHLAFAASANHDSALVLRSLAVRDAITPPVASSLYLAATANDHLNHTKTALDLYRQFLTKAAGRFPTEESEVRRRVAGMEHAK